MPEPPDPIDQAIRATAPDAPITLPVVIQATGRAAALIVPRDLGGFELLALIAWLATTVPGVLEAEQQRAQGSIVVPPRPTLVRPT
jgi:hypothetical protein